MLSLHRWITRFLYPPRPGEIRVVRPEYPYGDIRRHGATQRYDADNAGALEAAILSGIAATKIPNGDWRIAASKTIVPTFDINVIGEQGARLLFDGATLKFEGQNVLETAIAADASRGDMTVQLADVTGIKPHDVIFFVNDAVTETSWNYKTWCTTTVLSVDPSNRLITLAHPLNFDFGRSEPGNVVIVYRSAHRVTLERLTLHALPGNIIEPGTHEMGRVEFWGLKNVMLREIIQENNDLIAHAVMFIRCVDCRVENSTVYRGIGYNLAASRNITCQGLRGYDAIHVVTPTAWTDTVNVRNLVSRGRGTGIEAHPSFNIHYSNVDEVDVDGYYANLRCVGGSISNATVRHVGLSSTIGPYFHNVQLVDKSIYDDYDFVVDGLLYDEDGKAFGPMFGRNFIMRNSELRGGIDVGMGMGLRRSINEARIYDCTFPAFRARQLGVLETGNTVQHFVLNDTTDIYELGLLEGRVNYTRDRLYAQGDVFREIDDDPAVAVMRVYDLWQQENISIIYGILKLKARMRHANVGYFDVLEHHYHFCHKLAAASNIFFPQTPAFASSQSAQDKQTLAMAITDVKQEIPLETGGAAMDSYFQFKVTLSSGRSAPTYGLSYELELFR